MIRSRRGRSLGRISFKIEDRPTWRGVCIPVPSHLNKPSHGRKIRDGFNFDLCGGKVLHQEFAHFEESRSYYWIFVIEMGDVLLSDGKQMPEWWDYKNLLRG